MNIISETTLYVTWKEVTENPFELMLTGRLSWRTKEDSLLPFFLQITLIIDKSDETKAITLKTKNTGIETGFEIFKSKEESIEDIFVKALW